jgi:glycine cleavage system H lipoate-binding protein
MDDFAQKLVGRVDSVELPRIGSHLVQGEAGWNLVADSRSIPMLSPVDGVVVAVNQEVLKSPEILRQDPYGKGWLVRVRSNRIAKDTKNLLSGKLARAWMEDALDRLQPANPENLGPVLADGGMPIDGIARAIGGEQWAELARKHLLTEEE